MTYPIASCFLIAVIICGFLYQRRLEKREWNGGICAASGQPWQLFDYDSYGGRGYTDGQNNYCWISYNVEGK